MNIFYILFVVFMVLEIPIVSVFGYFPLIISIGKYNLGINIKYNYRYAYKETL